MDLEGNFFWVLGMRVSENLTKGGIVAHGVLALTLVVVAVMAAFHTFGARVLDKPLARFLVTLGLAAAVYLGTSRDFYAPFLGMGVLPPSVLKTFTPPDAAVVMAVDAPAGSTHAVYWAAKQSTLVFERPAAAYAGFDNSGCVAVAGGRATLRLNCPAPYKSALGRVVPRHVHVRFVFPNGALSAVKTLPVRCP